MRAPLAVAILLLLAGCSGEPPAKADLLQVAGEGEADGASLMAQPVKPQLRLLADVNESYTNPTPPPSPASGGQEWVVAEIELADGYRNLTFEFTRSHVSLTVWAPNCRLYQGDRLQDQAAFSDAGLGQAVSSGTCVLGFDGLPPGTYRAVYSDDALQPKGTHDVRLRATGWHLAPLDEGFEGRSART